MTRLVEIPMIVWCLLVVVSCDRESDISVEEACEDAIAFPGTLLDSPTQLKFMSLIGDLDLSQSTDDENCGEYAFGAADEMVQNAIMGSHMPHEELTEFGHSQEWFTGSASQPAACVSLRVRVPRRICDAEVIGKNLSVIWHADGVLDEVKSDCGGFVDYQNPVKNCDGDLWTLENCGGIFSSSGEYVFEYYNSEKKFVKNIMALCEPAQTYYIIPVCDDYLPSDMDTLCGIDFCSE